MYRGIEPSNELTNMGSFMGGKENLYHLYQLEMENRNDWRMFADELGYSKYEITAIGKRRTNYHSPTVLLFRMMIIIKSELNIEDMIPVCANLRRNYVAAHLRRLLERNRGY